MSQYGSPITNDEFYKYEEIFGHFVQYFKNPVMHKVEESTYDTWAAKIYSLLSRESRYIIVVTKRSDSPLYSQLPLSKINWISLQTRTFEKEYDIGTHNYIARRGGPLDVSISRVEHNNRYSTYSVEMMPITVTLLNKDGDLNEYHEKGSVITALETYSTIILIQ